MDTKVSNSRPTAVEKTDTMESTFFQAGGVQKIVKAFAASHLKYAAYIVEVINSYALDYRPLGWDFLSRTPGEGAGLS